MGIIQDIERYLEKESAKQDKIKYLEKKLREVKSSLNERLLNFIMYKIEVKEQYEILVAWLEANNQTKEGPFPMEALDHYSFLKVYKKYNVEELNPDDDIWFIYLGSLCSQKIDDYVYQNFDECAERIVNDFIGNYSCFTNNSVVYNIVKPVINQWENEQQTIKSKIANLEN
jgi:hypothetical protein